MYLFFTKETHAHECKLTKLWQFITQLLFFIIVRSDGVCMYSRRVTGSICLYIMNQNMGWAKCLTVQLSHFLMHCSLFLAAWTVCSLLPLAFTVTFPHFYPPSSKAVTSVLFLQAVQFVLELGQYHSNQPRYHTNNCHSDASYSAHRLLNHTWAGIWRESYNFTVTFHCLRWM